VKDLSKRPSRKMRAELEKEMSLGDESDDEDLGDHQRCSPPLSHFQARVTSVPMTDFRDTCCAATIL
jgi:hypothetical protein